MSIRSSNNNYAWDKLPTTILRTIFHHVSQSELYWLQDNASMLYACQLVCKNWKETAQEALYSQVFLGSNTLNFITTIMERKELGGLVKTFIILDNFSECGNVHELLEILITNCPLIQEMYTFQDTIQKEVWAYLNSANSRVPQYLKRFTPRTSDAATTPLYASIAMRFENTLTELQLCMHAGFINSAVEREWTHLLSTRLTRFTSLQYLRVDNWRLYKIQDLDRLLDSCSRTTCNLAFIHLGLEKCIFGPTVIIKQNTTVRALTICCSDTIPALMLKYLDYKLDGLQSFDGAYFTYPTGPKQNIDGWWHQLTKICLKTKSYAIKFRHSDFTNAQQLKTCIDFSHSTTAPSENMKNRFAKITLNRPPIMDCNAIALSKTWDTQTVSVAFDSMSYIDTILEGLSLYSAHQIHCKIQNMEEHYQMLTIGLVHLAQEDEFSQSTTKQKPMETCNKENTLVFFKVVSLASSQMNKVAAAAAVIFDRIVLCDKRPLVIESYYPSMLKVSELRFTNSILHPSALSSMSKIFTTINTLKIDTCCILMENPFCIDIFLPSTEITSLVLDIHPFVNATDWSAQKRKRIGQAHYCSLENIELLRAVTTEGNFMVKAETDDTTRVFYKQNIHGIAEWKLNPEHVAGNPYTFVIWIKCKQLDEIQLSAENGLMWRMKLQ